MLTSESLGIDTLLFCGRFGVGASTPDTGSNNNHAKAIADSDFIIYCCHKIIPTVQQLGSRYDWQNYTKRAVTHIVS